MGYVKGIVGNVVIIFIDEEEELGIFGIVGNNGELIYVIIFEEECG